MKVEETLGAAEIEQFLGAVSGDPDLAGFFDLFRDPPSSRDIDVTRSVAPWKTKPALKQGDGTGGTDAISKAVEEVQAAVGAPVDGKWGKTTTAAVLVWQNSKGLPPTGTFNADNWAVLYGKKTAAERSAAQQKTISDAKGFVEKLLAQQGRPAMPLTQAAAPPPPPPQNTFPWKWVLGGTVLLGLGFGTYLYVNREK